MQLTSPRPAAALPPLDALTLYQDDVPGFRRVYADSSQATNEAVASRAENPERCLRRLEGWGRLDGYAVRYVPESFQTGFAAPIVIDSSVARFQRGAGALQALMDDISFPDLPEARRLFPRNIADNTECVHSLFTEDGVQFALYRVDFRVQNIVGSVGVVWHWPHGGPIQALKLAERHVSRIRTALRHHTPGRERGSAPLENLERVQREQGQLRLLGKA